MKSGLAVCKQSKVDNNRNRSREIHQRSKWKSRRRLAQDNRDSKILEKSFKGKIPSPEEAKKVFKFKSTSTSVGKTSVHNPYKMLWNSHGVLWPRISANRSSTVRTYFQRQDADWEHFVQTESGSFAGFQDSSPVKFPLRKKSVDDDDDYQFALAVQESF